MKIVGCALMRRNWYLSAKPNLKARSKLGAKMKVACRCQLDGSAINDCKPEKLCPRISAMARQLSSR